MAVHGKPFGSANETEIRALGAGVGATVAPGPPGD
jgi:hypothetical protein